MKHLLSSSKGFRFNSLFQNTARAQKLRAKFEEWEQSQDAKDQMKQMMIHDENGSSLETASNLKAKFEALKMREELEAAEAEAVEDGKTVISC